MGIPFLDSLNVAVRSPLGQLGLGWLGSFEQDRAYREAQAANEERYNQGMQEYGDLHRRVIPTYLSDSNQALDVLNAGRERAVGESWNLYNQTGNAYQNRTNDLTSRYDQLANNVARNYGNRTQGVLGYLDNMNAEILPQYGARHNRALAYLDNASQQSRADINEGFDAQQGANYQDLVSRGLSSTSMLTNNRGATERERNAELRRFDEGVRREYLDADMQTSLDELTARERLGSQRAAYDADLTGQGLTAATQATVDALGLRERLTGEDIAALDQMARQAIAYDTSYTSDISNRMEQMAQRRAGYDMDITGNRIGFMERRSDPYPDNNWLLEFARQAGQSQADVPEPDSGAAYGAAGIGAGASLLAAKIIVFCIDGDSQLETKSGRRRLAELQVGDKVRSSSGEFKEIVFIDYGNPHESRMMDYITITTDLSSITLTKDHILEDKPAGEWKVGDRMRTPKGYVDVVDVVPAIAYPSGDILLEDNDDYVANGFYVGSMMSRYGIETRGEVQS